MDALKRTREKTILQPHGCCIVEMQEEQSLERTRHLEATVEMGKIQEPGPGQASSRHGKARALLTHLHKHPLPLNITL